jgi:hypothetical protein
MSFGLLDHFFVSETLRFKDHTSFSSICQYAIRIRLPSGIGYNCKGIKEAKTIKGFEF